MRKENFNSEEDVIRQLEEQERQAVLQQDLAALERLWSEEFIVNNPQNQISPSRDSVLALVKKGLIRYAAFERRIESIRFSADIAIVMSAETVNQSETHRVQAALWSSGSQIFGGSKMPRGT